MKKNLFDMVNINQEKTYVPNGLEPDLKKACEEYNSIINDLGGIDLQLLGLGHNGHIGFNEPGEAFEKETHCVDLTQSTIEASNMITTVSLEALFNIADALEIEPYKLLEFRT